jgi:hypothetical protein
LSLVDIDPIIALRLFDSRAEIDQVGFRMVIAFHSYLLLSLHELQPQKDKRSYIRSGIL